MICACGGSDDGEPFESDMAATLSHGVSDDRGVRQDEFRGLEGGRGPHAAIGGPPNDPIAHMQGRDAKGIRPGAWCQTRSGSPGASMRVMLVGFLMFCAAIHSSACR